MIGLMFFGAIALWGLIAFFVGAKLPDWLKLKPAWALLFTPLVLFAPVMDEVIAWPQMQMLCHNLEGYKFAQGMDEKSATGRTVYYTQTITPFDVFPPTVKVEKWEIQYVDAMTGEVVFERTDFDAKRGWLGIPAGSSGHAMTAFLKGCQFSSDNYLKFKELFKRLGITQVQTP